MNKNTILGFVLIAVILIGFSWYNSKIYKEQERERFVADSIARVEAAKYAAVEDSVAAANMGALGNELLKQQNEAISPVYKDSLIELASKAEPEYYTLENEKLKIVFTTKGAQPYSVLVKNYYTYDSLSLYLVKEEAARFDLKFFAGGELSSSISFSDCRPDRQLVGHAPQFSEDSYIDYIYNLPKDSYMLDFYVRRSEWRTISTGGCRSSI